MRSAARRGARTALIASSSCTKTGTRCACKYRNRLRSCRKVNVTPTASFAAPGAPPIRLYMDYHDEEWGVPLHDERRLFEMLCLEGAQAGLSWLTILRKREAYRRAFEGFRCRGDGALRRRPAPAPHEDAGIVRNRLKIDAFISNARAYLNIRDRPGAFDALYLAIHRRRGAAPPAAEFEAIARPTPVERGDEQGSQAARISFRRLDHLLRIHASRRDRR